MDDDETAFPFSGFSAESRPEADGWEALASTSASEENVRNWEMVAAYYNDCSIFPPSLHEGLHPHADINQTLAPLPSTTQQLIKTAAIVPCLLERSKMEEESGAVSHKLSISAQRMIASWREIIRSKISGIAEASGVGVYSFAALVGVAGFLMYVKRRHRREKEFLLFLIQEKNQKIGLLLHQIAELNAVLAAHRKVPVLRRT